MADGGGHWNELVLFEFGVKNDAGCAITPDSCLKVLEYLSESVDCVRCQIKFVVLQPGTHVLPKSGPTNTRLRSFLGKIILYSL